MFHTGIIKPARSLPPCGWTGLAPRGCLKAPWMARCFWRGSAKGSPPRCKTAIGSSWTIWPRTKWPACVKRLKPSGPDSGICRLIPPTSTPAKICGAKSNNVSAAWLRAPVRNCFRLVPTPSIPSPPPTATASFYTPNTLYDLWNCSRIDNNYQIVAENQTNLNDFSFTVFASQAADKKETETTWFASTTAEIYMLGGIHKAGDANNDQELLSIISSFHLISPVQTISHNNNSINSMAFRLGCIFGAVIVVVVFIRLKNSKKRNA